MRGVFEFTGFAGLALALHVAAFQSLPQGSESAGSGGEALVTMAAVSGSLVDMVATWDRPPTVTEVMPAALPMPQSDAADPVVRPADALTPPLKTSPRPVMPVNPVADAALPLDATQSAAPPPAPQAEAIPKVRPKARPAATPAKPEPAAARQAARPASTAAGSGASAAKGTRGPAETASLSSSARQSLMAEWGGKIRNRIDRAKPRGGGRGSVTVLLKVGRGGDLQSVGIAASSGQASLDQRAVQAVRSAGRLPAAPAALTDASYTFRLPIRFD
ncbi:MAG: TonB family protein [Rhodobacterales bacterium]|nr:TonB family protein [Rhodobacterales bacterium]MDX5412734.1 TonB family protein [Rhodobacterales bacterium]